MKAFSRAQRVADQISASLSTAILTEVNDARLRQVALTAVKLSDDLSSGRVYWTFLDASVERKPREQKSVERAFERAAGFLRSYVARNVSLKHVPELRFYFDEALERGRRMDALLSELDIPEATDPDDVEGAEGDPGPTDA